MKTHKIPLDQFKPTGQVTSKMENGELVLTAINGNNRVALPGAYKLPFRVDMTVKANSSDITLLVGKGGISFSGFINTSGGGIRRIDILTGKKETVKCDYENEIPLGEYINLSVVYGSKFTWVQVNDNICYVNGKAPYLDLPKQFDNGLSLAVRPGKNKVELRVRSFTVTEYENDEPPPPAQVANAPELSAFEWYIKSLPPHLRDQVIKIDKFLMADMKRVLKFKKSVDTYGNLVYASPCGFQFKLRKFILASDAPEPGQLLEFGHMEKHEPGQMATSWARGSRHSADYTSQVLEKIAETSPDFADKMYNQLQYCSNVKCKGNSKVEYKGGTTQTCSSSVIFTWNPADFADIRQMVMAVGEFMEDKK